MKHTFKTLEETITDDWRRETPKALKRSMEFGRVEYRIGCEHCGHVNFLYSQTRDGHPEYLAEVVIRCHGCDYFLLEHVGVN